MTEKTYIIENLGCANCAAKMEGKLRSLPGVENASITFATRQLRITAEDPDGLLPRINEIISRIEPDARAVVQSHSHSAQCACEHHDHEHQHHDHGHEHADTTPLPLLLGGIGFVAGFALEIFSLGTAAMAVFFLSWLLLGFDVLKTAGKNLLHGQIFDENFLMSIATIGAFLIGEFPEAAGVMLFYRVGEYFEHKAVERSRSQIMEAVDLRPETVTLISGETIPAGQAAVGDLLRIHPGDRIPLDGVVLSGKSRLDTSPITGEPVPVRVNAGDRVTSGCVNTTGQLTMRVEKPLSESMVSRILHIVEDAAAAKPKIDRFLTRFAAIYTPVVVLAAVAIALIPSLITGNWYRWIHTALSFLVMSCPCALVLSVPLAFFSGIGAGSKRGILFKGGAVMETLADIKAVIMDKTGTLTQGKFDVLEIAGPEELLLLCASCEQHSTHPIAERITAAAAGLSLREPQTLEEIPGHGIHALLDGRQILCGNEKLMEKFSVDLSRYTPHTQGTHVIVAVDGAYLGHITLGDALKKDAPETIRHIKAMGIHTALLTGDQEAPALAIANELGIDETHARLLPQDKLTQLQAIRAAHGAAMFVGDGINDAPVLAGADVGAAMGSGADAATEAADLILLNNHPTAIAEALTIARQTRRIAIQNVVFALAVKAVVMVLGLFGLTSLWAAVFADSGVAMLCVLNAVRILYRSPARR